METSRQTTTGSEPIAWICDAMLNPSLAYPVAQIPDYDGKRDGPTRKLMKTGYAQPAGKVPSAFYHSYPVGDDLAPPSYVFLAGGILAVNEPCADVIRKFDLGDGALHRTRLYQRDKATPLPGDYFLLNFGARKEAFLPEQPHLAYFNEQVNWWSFFFADLTVEDVPCTLSRRALEGADIWSDPATNHAVFASDRLVTALRAAGFDQRFRFHKCRIAMDD